jgi:hypothetical protein
MRSGLCCITFIDELVGYYLGTGFHFEFVTIFYLLCGNVEMLAAMIPARG